MSIFSTGEGTIPIVVPLADLANHSDEPNAIWRMDCKGEFFEMVTSRFVSKGSEITYNYGNQPLWKFLLHYGFVPAESNAKIPKACYEYQVTVNSHCLRFFDSDGKHGGDPAQPQNLEKNLEKELALLRRRKQLWRATHSASHFISGEASHQVPPPAKDTLVSVVLTSTPAVASLRFAVLLSVCRIAAACSAQDFESLHARSTEESHETATTLLSPVSRGNERRALLVASQVLQERTTAMKSLERTCADPSCLALLKGGSSLLRNVSRVVEDALLVVGEEGDSMHESGSNILALEVASDYAEATQWEGGGRGWRHYVPFGREYIRLLSEAS